MDFPNLATSTNARTMFIPSTQIMHQIQFTKADQEMATFWTMLVKLGRMWVAEILKQLHNTFLDEPTNAIGNGCWLGCSVICFFDAHLLRMLLPTKEEEKEWNFSRNYNNWRSFYSYFICSQQKWWIFHAKCQWRRVIHS